MDSLVLADGTLATFVIGAGSVIADCIEGLGDRVDKELGDNKCNGCSRASRSSSRGSVGGSSVVALASAVAALSW